MDSICYTVEIITCLLLLYYILSRLYFLKKYCNYIPITAVIVFDEEEGLYLNANGFLILSANSDKHLLLLEVLKIGDPSWGTV